MVTESAEISLNKSAGLPDGLSVAVQHRSRYETLDNSFRANSVGGDRVFSLRTLAQGELRLGSHFMFKAEMQDSRAELVNSGTLLDTTMVDPAELLEANLQWNAENLLADGSKSILRAGRLTMDLGDRRLVARNRFRNASNAFTGLDGIWQAGNGNQARVFYTLPIDHLPNQRDELAQNNAAMDRERLNRRFWGFFFSSPNLPWGNSGELYYFRLEEEDVPDFLTQNRRLHIPGVRVYLAKEKGRFDYEWTSTLQFGTSRASTDPTDTRDLDHFAHFHHAEAGYTFLTPWSPRVILEYDYASGDANANDGKNGAFDPLFGETFKNLAPSSIYSAFRRTNINSPGIQLEIEPSRKVRAFVNYRMFWLAEPKAPWAGSSGLQDTTGRASPFLGHQIFSQVKWLVFPNLLLEGGLVYRIDGDFQDTVPHSPQEGNTTYTYVSTTLFF